MAVTLTSPIMWICLSENSSSVSLCCFFEAVEIWIYRPNVIFNGSFGALVNQIEDTNCFCLPGCRTPPCKFDRQLLSKSLMKSSSFERVVVDTNAEESCMEVCFYPFKTHVETQTRHYYECLAYKLKYQAIEKEQACLALYVSSCNDIPKEILRPTNNWLQFVLFPKLCKWAFQEKSCKAVPVTEPLISMEAYYISYQRLKDRYSSFLVKNWSESTDPNKFVYEDIAIAAYLLVLWERERIDRKTNKYQTFLDLGCGNGLLVYLLSCEGHVGKGIDLRARKIWKFLEPTANLEVATITPSDTTLYPEYDWLIGNHSDELTPWIPVISSRSSFHSKYFLIPCCTHDFDRKFQRPNTLKSQYQSYLDYVELIGVKMGFIVHRDSLNIPSSKRVCFIGQKRNYLIANETSVDKERQLFIDSRLSTPSHHIGHTSDIVSCIDSHQSTVADIVDSKLQCSTVAVPCQSTCTLSINAVDKWAGNFKPRPVVESVKNCTHVNARVKEAIVSLVTSALLKEQNIIEIVDNNSKTHYWNRGGRLHLNEAVSLVSDDLLQSLKTEHGGIQTLLRNYCQIFEVKGGFVQLRNWSLLKCSLKSDKYQKRREWMKDEHTLLYKTKPCWFNDHHPDGCPRLPELCPYAHGMDELRNRPDFKKCQ